MVRAKSGISGRRPEPLEALRQAIPIRPVPVAGRQMDCSSVQPLQSLKHRHRLDRKRRGYLRACSPPSRSAEGEGNLKPMISDELQERLAKARYYRLPLFRARAIWPPPAACIGSGGFKRNQKRRARTAHRDYSPPWRLMEEAALALAQNSSKSMICRAPRSKARRERRRLSANQVAEVHFAQASLAFRLDSRTTGNTRVTSGQNCGCFALRQKL